MYHFPCWMQLVEVTHNRALCASNIPQHKDKVAWGLFIGLCLSVHVCLPARLPTCLSAPVTPATVVSCSASLLLLVYCRVNGGMKEWVSKQKERMRGWMDKWTSPWWSSERNVSIWRRGGGGGGGVGLGGVHAGLNGSPSPAPQPFNPTQYMPPIMDINNIHTVETEVRG